jgi:hypothetical protein
MRYYLASLKPGPKDGQFCEMNRAAASAQTTGSSQQRKLREQGLIITQRRKIAEVIVRVFMLSIRPRLFPSYAENSMIVKRLGGK